MAESFDVVSLKTAVSDFRSLHDLGCEWITSIDKRYLEVHIAAPDGWKSQGAFCAGIDLGSQATEFLNAEYDRWIVRRLYQRRSA